MLFYQRADVFAFCADDCQEVVYLKRSTLISTNMQEGAVFITLQIHGGFIRLHLCQQIALFNRIAHLFMPGRNHAFSHRIAQTGH